MFYKANLIVIPVRKETSKETITQYLQKENFQVVIFLEHQTTKKPNKALVSKWAVKKPSNYLTISMSSGLKMNFVYDLKLD